MQWCCTLNGPVELDEKKLCLFYICVVIISRRVRIHTGLSRFKVWYIDDALCVICVGPTAKAAQHKINTACG